jgi:hypothetical protein
MPETVDNIAAPETTTPEVVTPNPFGEGAWKTEPTATTPSEIVATDPVIEEKDEQIKEEKPISDKPNEPEKIPEATPKPIQERPENTDPQTKDEKPRKFANEESERVYNALIAGDKDKVLEILSEQKKLAEIDKMKPAEIIKLNLQYQNKDFTPQEINDLFEERYEYPEKPEQDYSETDEEFKKKEERYQAQVAKIESRIARDAKPASAELRKLSQEIVLPETRPATGNIEPTQEELEAQKQQTERFLQSVEEGLNNLNGYNATYKDEEVTIPVAYKMTKEDKAALRPIIELSNTNAAEFLTKIGWLDKEGNINTAKLSEDLPFILDKDKIISKMVTETGNKRRTEAIKTVKNIDYSGQKSGGGEIGESREQLQTRMAQHFFSS